MGTPTVAVISMGGTISCAPGDDGRALVPRTDAADLVSGDSVDGVEVRSVQWSLSDSSEITFNEMIRLAREIRRQAADGADAVVVTQGTDSLEESAYVLSLLQPLDRPVVCTGAMRAPTAPGSDAAGNLRAAIATALDPQLAQSSAGAVVVMNDEIHSAKWVQKHHTQRVDAFTSTDRGPLGVLYEGRPRFLRQDPPPSLPALLDRETGRHVRVALLTAVLDQDTALIEAVARSGYHGLVIEGMGGGHVSGVVARAVGALARDIPVVYASRSRAGAVLERTYGSPGAELDLIDRGAVPAGELPALKARVLLTMLLRSGYSRREVETLLRREAHAGPC
ncbi:asparaginase [Mycolicibacterium vaccae]|uniref:asparaginase n=1 Tax=Mycolicibacterium vaccae TaxID=1810 RepID=UPI003D06D343